MILDCHVVFKNEDNEKIRLKLHRQLLQDLLLLTIYQLSLIQVYC